MGYRVLVIGVVAGCASTASIGAGGTTVTSGGGGGFDITANSEAGFRVGGNFEIGLTSNMHFGNWTRVGNAYGQLNEWARGGTVDCCDKLAPLLTVFKYFGLGVGYMTAWMVAADASLVGPRLRYYVQPYAPTLYFDLGAGPAAFFDEDRSDAIFGIGTTVAAGYMFDPYWGIEARSTWGNANDPQWATFSIGLVIKPKKRFLGLFGRNDLEKPAPKPQPQTYPPPQPYQPMQPYQPLQPQPAPPAQPQPAQQPQPSTQSQPAQQPQPSTEPQPAQQPQPSMEPQPAQQPQPQPAQPSQP